MNKLKALLLYELYESSIRFSPNECLVKRMSCHVVVIGISPFLKLLSLKINLFQHIKAKVYPTTDECVKSTLINYPHVGDHNIHVATELNYAL